MAGVVSFALAASVGAANDGELWPWPIAMVKFFFRITREWRLKMTLGQFSHFENF